MLGPIDPRDRQLAHSLIHYSVKAKEGDLVFIHCTGEDTLGLGAAIVEEAAKVGAAGYLSLQQMEIQRGFLNAANEPAIKRMGEFETMLMKSSTCYIGLRGAGNIFEMSDVPRQKIDWWTRHVTKPAHMDVRVKKTRWCVLRYPNASMAQLAQKSTAAFAEFYYGVCLLDYAKMKKAVEPLRALMNRTDRVRILAPGTDLSMSIKDIPAIPCTGELNIPDGECFTAPVRDSVNGTIQFNTPTAESGSPYENIRLRFEKGKVVEATGANAAQTKKLNEVLDRDEGARYLGELAIGFNPRVLDPMRDILFDEKIAGSIHMALGNCYDEAPNGNESSVHWDLVLIQRPEYGGGELWFDDTLVRKDGHFLLPELAALNPEHLGA